MFRFLVQALLLTASAFAQAPFFEAANVQIPNSNDTTPLGPGELISIYGDYLGPVDSCQGRADPDLRETPNPLRKDVGWNNLLVFPKELCGVRVLVGGEPAGLLYVHRDQINFKVPQSVPMEGTVGLQVVHGNQASAVIHIEAGMAPLRLTVPEPAFTSMPIWVQVWIPPNRGASIQYPFSGWPSYIGCNELQLRKDGHVLDTTFPARGRGGVGSGPLCGSGSYGNGYENRLPLHLLYTIKEPGDYEVRLNMMRERHSAQTGFEKNIFLQSEWTPLRIETATQEQRDEWLDAITKNPPVTRAEITGDYLPSILGVPDQQSLAAVVSQLYHLDQWVTQYAMQALTYWPEQQVTQALLNALQRNGPSDAIADWLLAWKKDRADVYSVIETILPDLHSSNPVRLRGALQAISRTVWLEESQERDELDAKVMTLLLAAERTVIASGDRESQRGYIGQLGSRKDVRAAPILWRFVDEGIALGSSLRALAMIARPEDLPTLAEYLFVPNMHRDYYSEIGNMPQELSEFYGVDAFGYLERLIVETDSKRLRDSAGEGLIAADHPATWTFIAEAIENNAPYKEALMQRLVPRYLAASESEAAMAALARQLAASPQP